MMLLHLNISNRLILYKYKIYAMNLIVRSPCTHHRGILKKTVSHTYQKANSGLKESMSWN